MSKDDFCDHMENFISLIGDNHIQAWMEIALEAYQTGVPSSKGHCKEYQTKQLEKIKERERQRTGIYSPE